MPQSAKIKFTPSGTVIAADFIEDNTGAFRDPIPANVDENNLAFINVKALTERNVQFGSTDPIEYKSTNKELIANNYIESGNVDSIQNFIPILGLNVGGVYLANYDDLVALGYNNTNVHIRIVRKDHHAGRNEYLYSRR